MKLYVDICGAFGGQLIMQQALKDEVVRQKMYAPLDEADVLIYVQIPLDFDINIWKKAKAAGKSIIFIHHYFEKFENFCIFKVPGALKLIDLHITIGKDCALHKYLKTKVKHIITYEQVCVNQHALRTKYLVNDIDKLNSICFVGRFNKGAEDFAEYVSQSKFDKFDKTIFCLDDKYYQSRDLSKFNNIKFVLNHSDHKLFSDVSTHRFIYMNQDMNASTNHFETVMHEAMALGVVIILGANPRRYINVVNEMGFLHPDDDVNLNYSYNQFLQFKYLTDNFLTRSSLLQKNIDMSVAYHLSRRKWNED